MMCPGSCWHSVQELQLPACLGHWDVADSLTRGSGGCLRKSFVHSEPMNQLIKEKAGLPRAWVGGGGKERNQFIFMSLTEPKFSFFWKLETATKIIFLKVRVEN